MASLEKIYDQLASRIKKGDKVLDLGCGTGALSLRAAQRGARVKGIDINYRMLKIAQIRADKTKLSQKIEFREMAVAWAFPMSVVFSVVMIPFWRGGILPLVFLVWGLYCSVSI